MKDLGFTPVFGGGGRGSGMQEIAVPEERLVHSFTATFFATAILKKPMTDVKQRVSGNSFSARRVAAIQNQTDFICLPLSGHQKRVSNIKKQCCPRPATMALTSRKRKIWQSLAPPAAASEKINSSSAGSRPVEFRNPH